MSSNSSEDDGGFGAAVAFFLIIPAIFSSFYLVLGSHVYWAYRSERLRILRCVVAFLGAVLGLWLLLFGIAVLLLEFADRGLFRLYLKVFMSLTETMPSLPSIFETLPYFLKFSIGSSPFLLVGAFLSGLILRKNPKRKLFRFFLGERNYVIFDFLTVRPFEGLFKLFSKEWLFTRPNWSSLRERKIEFGRASYGKRLLYSPSLLTRHMQVIGGSGSGKSTFLRNIYTHHFESGAGFAFLDLKAEWDTVSEFVGLAEKSGRTRDLQIIHLSRPDISVNYNPLARGNATQLKDKLMGGFTWSEPYYEKVSESFLLTVLEGLVVIRDRHSKMVTLNDLYELTCDPTAIRVMASELPKKNAKLRERLSHLSNDMAQKARFNEIQSLRTELQVLVHSEFSPILTNPSGGIDLLDTIKQGKILYFLADSQRSGKSAYHLGRLLFSDIKAASGAIVSETSQSERKPFTVIIDEFGKLGLPDFSDFFTQARASKIGVIISHQDLSDLDDISPTLKEKIASSVKTVVAFSTKNPDSAEFLAKMVGTKTVEKTTRQEQAGFLFSASTGMTSVREGEQYLIHPNQFKQLPDHFAYFISFNPLHFDRIKVRYLKPERGVLSEEIKKVLRSNGAAKSLREAFEPEAKAEVDANREKEPIFQIPAQTNSPGLKTKSPPGQNGENETKEKAASANSLDDWTT